MPTGISSYNPYVDPTSGQGPYGMVPGQIGIPNPYADLSGVFPSLPGANKIAGTDLLSQLGGEITPGTRNALKLASAQFGQGSGMPLSGLSTNQLFGNIAGFAENQVQKGMQNYASLIPTISKTQTVDPSLLTDIAARNALYAAAPDPSQAQNLAQKLFADYLSGMRGPAGGTTPSYGTRGPAAGTTMPQDDTRGITYGGTTYYGGQTPVGAADRWAAANQDWLSRFNTDAAGGGGVGLPAGGVPTIDWTSVPGLGDFSAGDGAYNPATDINYGAPYNPLIDINYPVTGPTPYTYMGENLPIAPSDQDYWNAVLGTF